MILRFLQQFGIYIALGLLAAFLWMRLDTVSAERDLARSQVSTLSEQLNEQNNAVLALEAAAAQNREVYLAGLDAANRRAIRFEIKAEELLRLPEPAPSEVCEVTEELLRKGLR